MFAKTVNYAETENGMPAYKSTLNPCVDLFYAFGASRGQNILPLFKAAFDFNPVLAVRVALWGRDVRGGAGERQLFRDILAFLAEKDQALCAQVLPKVPEVGRWDDLLSVKSGSYVRDLALALVKLSIEEGNGLAAKWMPRKGLAAIELRNAWKMSAKQYRRFLVDNTKVVEQQMCANNWTEIEFSKVPSKAMTKYRQAFERNAPFEYGAYLTQLAEGKTKVNTAAVYPYEILDLPDGPLRTAMWDSQPNYMQPNAAVLPVIDRSGSMRGAPLHKSSATAEDVANALGLYCADKNTGPFKDLVVTFAEKPAIMHLTGSLSDKLRQIVNMQVGYSTNLMATLDVILQASVAMKVANEDMPKCILLLSDMQFNDANEKEWSENLMQTMRNKFASRGYDMPAVVFWNLNHYGNMPAVSTEAGVMMVSGFSPSILKSVLAAQFDTITPEALMLNTVLAPRYDF